MTTNGYIKIRWNQISNNKAPVETDIARQEVDLTGQPLLGEKDAPVTVVEFGDYKCPSCKAWGEMIYPQLVEDYVLSGDVNFSYVNVLFHGKESVLASLGAESVYKQDPEVYWDFHKNVFDAHTTIAAINTTATNVRITVYFIVLFIILIPFISTGFCQIQKYSNVY